MIISHFFTAAIILSCSVAWGDFYRTPLVGDATFDTQVNNTLSVSHVLEFSDALLSEPNKTARINLTGVDTEISLTVDVDNNQLSIGFDEFDIYNHQFNINLEAQLALYNELTVVYNLFFNDLGDRWQAQARYGGQRETIGTFALPDSQVSEFGGIISTEGPIGGFVVVEAIGLPEPSSLFMAVFIALTTAGRRNANSNIINW